MEMKYLEKFFILTIFRLILVHLLFTGVLQAQQEPSAIQFHGANVLDGQFSNRQGNNSSIPKDFLRNDLQMTMTVGNIPVASSFFITTEQKEYMQKINNLRFYIDLPALKKNRARIEAANKANNLPDKKAPWTLRFLSNFSRIEAGRYRPDYGELTLQGISVSGANIEFTHKIVYAAFASGVVKRKTEEVSIFSETYKQKLLFGKLGFGEKRTSHFYLTYMRVEDESTTPLYAPEDTASILKPQANMLVGAEFRLSFLKNKWTIDGEAGVSALTRDTRITTTYDSVLIDTILSRVPEFIVKEVNPNISTSGDYAYSFNTRLNLRTTTIYGAYKWIGPGYFTLGNPILVNDRQSYEGRVDQALMKRKLTVSAYYKNFRDNLIEWKRGTTISTAYGIIAKLTLKKAPFFQLSYTPNNQETNGDSLYIRNHMNVVSFSTGYKYPIGRLMSFTSLNYFNQNAEYNSNARNDQNKTRTLTLNQVLNFKEPFQVNFNMSFSNMKNASQELNRKVMSFVLSGSHTFKNKWKNTLGGKYLNSNGKSDENKINIFWDTQLNILKNLDFGLSIDENIFMTTVNPNTENFNELIVQCKMTVRW
jgi:hypothetical protein